MSNRDNGRSLLRSLNSGAVLRTVIEHGPISRAGIARHTNLTNVTVGAIASEMLEQDLISETGQTDSTAGRPGRLLELNADAYMAVGAKLSDRQLTCELTDLRANVLAETAMTLEHPSPEDFIAALDQLVSELLATTSTGRDRLLGVGVGLPGVIDRATGTARYSPFLRWADVPVADLAEAALGLPVFIENDVNTLALTERWFGRGHGVRDFLLVTLGQGIGMGIVLSGELHSGARGGVGEFGHMVVSDSAQECECGNVGCLEAIASEGSLLRQSAVLTEASGAPPAVGMDDLYRLAVTDPDHKILLETAGESIGRGIANAINVLSPELVLVRGLGSFEASPLASAIDQAVQSHTFPGLAGSTEVIFEQLNDGPWARGAASLVLSELFMSPVAVANSRDPLRRRYR